MLWPHVEEREELSAPDQETEVKGGHMTFWASWLLGSRRGSPDCSSPGSSVRIRLSSLSRQALFEPRGSIEVSGLVTGNLPC